jgi:hypothetical protein
MAKSNRATKSADWVILEVLAYEFSDEPRESTRKIRRRLRYHGLGPYQQERVDLLRRFKNDIEREITQAHRSRYYLGNTSGYSAMEDFDCERLARDFSESYPEIPLLELRGFIGFAIYLFYMR